MREETKEGFTRLAEWLKGLGTELKLTVREFDEPLINHDEARYAVETHELHITPPGAESAMISCWEVVSRGRYNLKGEWISAEAMGTSRSPNLFAAALMEAYGLPDAPPPIVPEPVFDEITPFDSPDAKWAVWEREPTNGSSLKAVYATREAAYWNAMKLRSTNRFGRYDDFVLAPRRDKPMANKRMDELHTAISVALPPQGGGSLNLNHLAAWVHPHELKIDGW
jgi:hypothetical protein